MKKQKTHTGRLLGGIFVSALITALAVPHIAAAKQHTTDKKNGGEKQTMSEQTNPNIGKKFPEVSAESLANRKESIPDSARGKVVLVTVAFLRENQGQLDSWLEPFIEKYGDTEDVTFYEIPMISSGYRFMRFIIDNGMRAGLPRQKHKHVVTMYGDVEKYTDGLNIDPRYGHAFLLDREGIIRWQDKGFATKDSLAELFSEAEKLRQ